MVLPLAIGAGAAIGSGILGYMASKDAAEANAADRRKMQELLDKVQDPAFDTSMITPEEYQVLETYVPEQAAFVAEERPDVVQAASEGAIAGRGAQMDALESLRGIGQGDDLQMDAALQEASQSAARESGARRAAIQQAAARRGQAGSGMELASQLAAMSEARQSEADMGRRGAVDAQRQRLEALMGGANLGGQIRGEDVALESRNVDILNDFNRRMTQGQQSYLDKRAQEKNQAALMNMQAKQSAADQNIGARNQERVRSQEMGNQYAQQKFGNEMARLGQQSSMMQSAAKDRTAGATARGQMFQGIAGAIGAGADYYGGEAKSTATPAQANLVQPQAPQKSVFNYNAMKKRNTVDA